MAQQGATGNVGENTDQGKEKDFKGSGMEGDTDAAQEKPGRIKIIVGAIGGLNPETDFTGGGKP